MLESNIRNIWIYVYNMVNSTCYITYAIYHTCFAYIAYSECNCPKCYIAPPVMPDVTGAPAVTF